MKLVKKWNNQNTIYSYRKATQTPFFKRKKKVYKNKDEDLNFHQFLFLNAIVTKTQAHVPNTHWGQIILNVRV